MGHNRYKILVVEDEENIKDLLRTLLETQDYQVIAAENCRNGLMLYASHRPDLVILDLGLPDRDGMEFLREVRKDSMTPVIVLSARTDESDKVGALDEGANDYVTKPFGTGELLARVRSALRNARYSAEGGRLPGGKFETNGLCIVYDARQVFLDGAEIRLTQTEYNILAMLSQNAGKVMTYAAIIREVWGEGSDANTIKRLQVNMANIRKKFGVRPGKKSYVVNELGIGYRMCE